MKKLFCLFAFVCLLGAGQIKRVFLITMDNADEHWQEVYNGANKALEESDERIHFKWLAPDSKSDAQQQTLLQKAVAQKAEVVMISVNSPYFLSETMKDAMKKGVKFIYIDSPGLLEASQTLQTNNELAGKEAANEMLKHLKSRGIRSGNIGIITVNPYTKSLIDREKGFREVFKKEDYKIFSTKYNDGKVKRAKEECLTFLQLGIVGIFSANEGATKGVEEALQENDFDVVAVGFDTPKTQDELEKKKVFSAIIRQNPYQMGYLGMKSAIKLLKGEELPQKLVDTGLEILRD